MPSIRSRNAKSISSPFTCAYDEEFAIEQIERLDRILHTHLAESPLTWAYFPLTGAPYRAYLFRTRTVDILSFWNTARDPDTLDV